MAKDIRRHPRVPFPGGIRLSWQDPTGNMSFALGRCIDLSASGMRLELPVAIPVRSYVTMKTDQGGIATNASVRHCARAGGKYIVGIEFSMPLRPTDAKLPESLRKALLEVAAAGT